MKPASVTKFEVMSPSARKSKSALDRANAVALEQMVGTLAEVPRQCGGLAAVTAAKLDSSALVDSPCPPRRARPSRKVLKIRTASDGRIDADKVTLERREGTRKSHCVAMANVACLDR